jgi:hypothetical protein
LDAADAAAHHRLRVRSFQCTRATGVPHWFVTGLRTPARGPANDSDPVPRTEMGVCQWSGNRARLTRPVASASESDLARKVSEAPLAAGRRSPLCWRGSSNLALKPCTLALVHLPADASLRFVGTRRARPPASNWAAEKARVVSATEERVGVAKLRCLLSHVVLASR